MQFKYLALLSAACAVVANNANYIVTYDPETPDYVIDEAVARVIEMVSLHPYPPVVRIRGIGIGINERGWKI
jgi:hypothetical protein